MNHSANAKRRRHSLQLNRAITAGLEALENRTLFSGDILATVIQDTNRNGVADAGEPGLAGWTVFVDLDKNGVNNGSEPSAVTDTNGVATIHNLAANSYNVNEIVPAGFAPAAGFKDFDHVTVHDGGTSNVNFLNVTSATTGDIQGTVWNDVGGDGVRDAGDPGLPGWTVYLDNNANRVLDAGEPTAVTDSTGAFSFTSLTPGKYNVREISQPGWNPTLGADGKASATVTAGGVATVSLGNFNAAGLGVIQGTVWNDVNADGVRAFGDSGLSGWTVYLDLDNNGSLTAGEPTATTDTAGAYSFPSIAVGTYRVSEVLQSGWNLSPGHPISVTVTNSHETPGIADFANFTPTLGNISGRIWNDADGNGFIGASEAGLSGWTVFIDQDGDGLPGAGEPTAVTDAGGNYTLADVPVGSAVVREVPQDTWTPTAPGTGMQEVTVQNAAAIFQINFGNKQRTDSAIGGMVFADANHNGVRDAGEKGLSGVTVYLDLNNNGSPDAGEPSMLSMADQFFTPTVNEAGTYQFTHLAAGSYHVRESVPALLSATPASVADQFITLTTGQNKSGVDFADVYRPNEIHGMVFDDVNHNHVRDAGEAGIGGVTVYIDVNRNNTADPTEPRTVTGSDGSYSFTTNLSPGSYVIRALHYSGREDTYPTTTSGILWPTGVSNPAIGNVTPGSITTSLADGQVEHDTVSLTLPNTGALTNMVDVFLLFDDTGSFTGNSPIVRAAFPQIISTLQAAMPGVDFGFGVGRFEEYANFAAEFSTGRPFILNQPIIDQSTPGFSTSIQAALDRTAPGYGGDQPETDIEALYQMATGVGFDGNNNGTTTDSGAAGQVATQVTPGDSGDVPAFGSFTVDPSGNVLPAAGNIGGAGFRPGALPIILTATDTGFAFQPMGETSITGANGVTLPISALLGTSRPTTPFSSGAGIQQTVTALNALGALVIGLGTNGDLPSDPRHDLSALATLTGAVNKSTVTIPNGTLTPIAPGDPLYFQISSGFGPSVANGIVTAIENAVSNVAVNVTLKASDPNVHIESLPGVIHNLAAGGIATFDVAFQGDGRPHRFDLQFVREGTNVVLGSIPVVIGTPITGDGYEYVELEDGEIHIDDDFGDSYNATLPVNVAPSFDKGGDQSALDNSGPHSVSGWATAASAGPASDAGQVLDYIVTNDNNALFTVQPSIAADGTLAYTPAAGAFGQVTVTVQLHDSGGTVGGGVDTSTAQTFIIDLSHDAAAGHMVLPTGDLGSWNGSTYTGITGQIARGRNGGTWDGDGLFTSAGSADFKVLGAAKASEILGPTGGDFAGQPVDPSDVLVMYTYGGDANLDGKLNIDDYVKIDSGIASGMTGWSNGDFNYDGKINIDDYVVIDGNIGNQGAPLLSASSTAASGIGSASAPKTFAVDWSLFNTGTLIADKPLSDPALLLA